MSFRHKTYGGLVSYDHKEKIIVIERRLNPLQHHALLVSKLKEEYPEYQVVTGQWVVWLLKLRKQLL